MNRYLLELVERVGAVYGVTFLALVTTPGFDLTDVSGLRAAGIAAVPAGLMVVYGALAAFVGDRSPALLPARGIGE